MMESPGALPSGGLVFQLVCRFHRYGAYSSKSTVQPKTESCFQDGACSASSFTGSSAFSKSSLNIWKFTVQVLLKWQEETNIKYQISFPSLYKIKRRLLLKFCVANTCFYLNLTFLKPELTNEFSLWKCF